MIMKTSKNIAVNNIFASISTKLLTTAMNKSMKLCGQYVKASRFMHITQYVSLNKSA